MREMRDVLGEVQARIDAACRRVGRDSGEVEVIAVTKTHGAEVVKEAWDAGLRIVGENKVQEAAWKKPASVTGPLWHLIGHLQTNKARLAVQHATVIQSIDSLRLLRLVDKEAARIGRTIKVMLQLHVAQEETKSGFTPDELIEAANSGELDGLTNVTITGLMAMATNTDDMALVEREFATVQQVFETLKCTAFAGSPAFAEVSMGMSDDWPIAVRHGSTLVRIGTAIFGPREY